MPCRLSFRTVDTNGKYVTIFKHGDDLRQDQLVLQIITLMDKVSELVRIENDTCETSIDPDQPTQMCLPTVAQSVARLTGDQEVAGLIPTWFCNIFS